MKEDIVISIGDPYGVGPEIIAKSWSFLTGLGKKITIVGSVKSIEYHQKVSCNQENSLIEVLDPAPQEWELDKVGQDCAQGGALSFLYVQKAVQRVQSGSVLVTAPISKNAWRQAGVPYSGHTDFFEKTVSRLSMMCFYSPRYLLALVTHHVPLKEVASLVTAKKIQQTVKSMVPLSVLMNKNKNNFNIAVCGLNPHASDQGLIGKEEEKEIIPAIQQLKEEGFSVSGPYSADTLFAPHMIQKFEAVIAMYHDQGLIPFKSTSFHEGVNFTVNLPFIRTSPDHGTAFDIVGKGVVSQESFLSAVRLAMRLKEAT